MPPRLRWWTGLPRRQRVVIAGSGCALVLALFIAAVSTSSGDGGLPPPKVTSSTDPAAVTSVPDFSGVPLGGVAGATTTSLLANGRSTLKGTVTGPDGPVAKVKVRFERLVGSSVHGVDILTDDLGAFVLEKAPGGRYRVRAFLAPTLAQVTPEIFFLVDGDTKELALRVESFEGMQVVAATAPVNPVLGGPVNVTVRVAETEVDGNGVVRPKPLPNLSVELVRGRWRPIRPNSGSGLTNANGEVTLELECAQSGPAALGVTVGADPTIVPLEVPDCADPGTTTTATSPEETTTSTSPTSSTTTESTTTTTSG